MTPKAVFPWLFHAAFGAGLLALAWVGAGYGIGSPLALALVLLITTFYGLGCAELFRYRRATAGLLRQLRAVPVSAADTAPTAAVDADAPTATVSSLDAWVADLAGWLAPMTTGLRPVVRGRLLGQRLPLPGPALAPYLCGLLVLLGMLGTFLGLVMTLQGTGLALEQASDVAAIRASLAAPVRGLGLAFGTSVAGVAASAALGLMVALARRERAQAGEWLDSLASRAATALRTLDPAWQAAREARRADEQREEAARQEVQRQAQSRAEAAVQRQQMREAQAAHEARLQALLQSQTEQMRALAAVGTALPALVQQLQQLAQQTGHDSQRLQQALLQGQAQTQAATTQALDQALGTLAERVGRGLQSALADSAQAAAAAVAPVVESTLQGLAELQARAQAEQAQQHAALLQALRAEHGALLAELARQQQAHQAALAQAVRQQLDETQQLTQARSSELLQALTQAQALQARQWGEQAQAQLLGLQTSLGDALAAQAQGLIGEVARLVETAAQAPRAAAALVTELRSTLSDSLVRDNAALAEREQLLGTLAGLLQTLQQAGSQQREAVDGLVQAARQLVQDARQQLQADAGQTLQLQQQALAEAAAAAAGMAGVAERFAAGVGVFARASEDSCAQLARTESALRQALVRSDEQLAYYVAQAREIVDLTLGSQREVVEELQQVVPRLQAQVGAAGPAASAGGV